MNRKFFIILAAAVVLVGARSEEASANHLQISNAAVLSPNAASDTAQIQFDISWENSWRNSTNHDAVWIFVKYSTDSGATWNHATLKTSGTNPSGFSVGSGTGIEILVPSDKKGAWIRRSSNGSGDVSVTSAQLVWDYGTSGLSDSASVRIKVLGIEMVYVAEGNFYLGDGDGASESAFALHVADNTSAQITSAVTGGITCDANGDDDIDSSPISVDGDGGITGNGSWPTGYRAFYLMKYEITESQWVDFFNMLTGAQKINRDITGVAGKNSDTVLNRNTVSWVAADATTSSPDRACGFLSWMDGAAYADWAALRPVTELEYEKAGRGTLAPASGEFAWGSSASTIADTISGTEDGTETISTPDANLNSANTVFSGGDASSGPLRAGIFATSMTSRSQAGAGYYGSMELSGNLLERCVTLGNVSGRSFVGSHGDGVLTVTASYEGNATNVDWPGINATAARGVTSAGGSGMRGGSWSSSAAESRTSDRTSAANTNSARSEAFGFRAGRTA